MKKRNMTLPKRLLAMSLSLAMCLGMVCTTAFAAGDDAQDYVYVYINVEKDKVETPSVTKPDFSAERDAITAEQGKVDQAQKDVDDAAKNVGEIPTFTAPTDEANPEGQTNLDVATGAVEEALKELTGVEKPEYKEATDTPDPDAQPGDSQTPDPDAQTGDGQTPDPDTPDESKDKSFTDTVNETVDGLNGVIGDTEQAVKDGKDKADTAAKVELDDGTNSTLAAEKAKLDAAAKEALDKLNQARADAEQAVKDANALTEAFNAKDFQKELDDAIDALEKPTNKPTAPTAPVAPVVENFETYEAYEAAFATYETARETYEADFETYQTKFKEYEDAVSKYNADVAQLKANHDKALADEKKAADDKVEAAKTQLQAAQAALDAFNAIKDKYGPGTDEIPGLDVAANSEVIQKYNDALKAYNDAVAGYNGKADAYNDAANAYNDAVKEYDDAVGKYNDKVTGITPEDLNGYNNQVGKYNDAVTEYGKKVEEFNGKVGDYNGQIDDFNSQQIKNATDSINTSNSRADDLSKALQDLSADIVVTKTDANGNKVETKVSGTDTSAWANLSDEEYNQAVAEYNNRVNAYNLVLTGTAEKKGYNEQSVDDKLTEVDKYFNVPKHTTASGDHWYTVGKISVDGIFSKNPKDILFNNLDSSKKDHNAPTDPDKLNDVQGPKYTEDGWHKDANGQWEYHYKDDYKYTHPTYYGRDVYHFDVNEETGEMSSTPTDAPTLKNDDDIYARGKTQEDLLKALDSQNLNRYQEKNPDTSADFDPTQDIDKWVLKVSYGANNYTETNGKEVFHLDGYLRVQQLATLATLEERIVNNYETMDKVEVKNTIGEYDEVTGELKNGLKDADTYDPYQAVMMPNSNPQPKDENPDWNGGTPTAPKSVDALTQPSDQVAGNPDQIVPGTPVTPPPEPEDGNPGGGGGGGGDTPPVIINDPDVPLAETPEEPVEEPVVEIPDEEVPLAETPEEVVIPDEDVPLAAVPQTGDISTAWYAVALTSACALAAVSLRKKEDED